MNTVFRSFFVLSMVIGLAFEGPTFASERATKAESSSFADEKLTTAESFGAVFNIFNRIIVPSLILAAMLYVARRMAKRLFPQHPCFYNSPLHSGLTPRPQDWPPPRGNDWPEPV